MEGQEPQDEGTRPDDGIAEQQREEVQASQDAGPPIEGTQDGTDTPQAAPSPAATGGIADQAGISVPPGPGTPAPAEEEPPADEPETDEPETDEPPSGDTPRF